MASYFVPRCTSAKLWALRWYPCTTGTAIAATSVVDWPATATGYFEKATSSTTKLCGILQTPVASADSSGTLKAVLVPIAGPESIVTAQGSDFSSTTYGVGHRCDLTDETSLNGDAHAVGRFVVTKYHSTTEVEGYFLAVAQTAAS